MERVREKEEKEAKRRKRLADDFFHFLSSFKVQQAVCQLKIFVFYFLIVSLCTIALFLYLMF